MKFVLDVGNSNIACGIFLNTAANYQIEKTFRLTTPKTITTDELAIQIKNMLAHQNIQKKTITEAIFCSVVPSLNHNITKLMQIYFHLHIHSVTHNHFADFHIDYHKPKDIGIDRLVNLKAAVELFKMPLIIVDIGTAITIDVLHIEKKYLGGMIIPGLAVSLNALVENTSNLPKIELSHPEKMLGNSTKENMQNGTYFLYRLGIHNIVQQIHSRYLPQHDKITIVLTGGLAPFLLQNYKNYPAFPPHFQIEIIPNLTLIGLKILLEEMHSKKK